MGVFVGIDWGCGSHAVCVIDEKGTVHVPIDVAKEELLKRGLPTRAPGGNATPGSVQSLSGAPAVSAPQVTTNKPKG